MDGLAISPQFLNNLQAERGLSHDAFVAACGLSDDRYQELASGAVPTGAEIVKIVAGFNLTDGIRMVPSSQRLVA